MYFGKVVEGEMVFNENGVTVKIWQCKYCEHIISKACNNQDYC